jgi:hypothetical protein
VPAAALLTIALIFLASGPQLSTAAAIAAVAALFVYIGSFAIGLGPVFWLLISEIYPVRVRASAMSAAACANWAANFRRHHLVPDPAERDHRCGHVLHVRLPHRAGAHLLLAAGTGDPGPAAGRHLGGPRPAAGRHAIMEEWAAAH